MEIVKISETKFVRKIKSLPISTQRITGMMVLVILFVALPLFIWAVVTQRVFFKKQAASGEMSGEPGVCIAYNNFVDVTPVTDVSAPCHDIQSAINAVANNGTVMIEPGIYNINSTINVNGKTNITITGNTYYSNDAAVLNFIPNGWGFLVQNSSGSIQKLKIQGGSSNGMISILNSSDFQLSYLKVSSNTSHTIDVQGSTNININNSEISSSAGALEIQNSTYTSISNNKIVNSSNAVAINNSSGTVMMGNLIASNRESGLYIYNANDTVVNHNTFNNNSMTSSSAAISLNGAVTLFNFNNNLVIYTHTAGVAFSGSTFTRTFGNNDLWSNLGGNYVGFDDYTGVNGNISEDPLVDYSGINFNWCLRSGSPAVYGNANSYDIMGSLNLCGTSSPVPSPIPTANSNPPTCLQSNIPPATGGAPLAVTLYGSGGSGNGVGIDGYQWDFENDGIWDTNVSIDPQNHVYLLTGLYNPVYRVHNTNNIWSSICDYPYPIVVGSTTPTSSPTPNPGDVNRDGRVNIVDIGILIDNYRLTPINDPRADINKDGVVNIVDIGIIIDNYEL